MDREDDVERLFSWLKTPDLRYREFASERDFAEASATWPTLQQTNVDTAEALAVAAEPETAPVPLTRVSDPIPALQTKAAEPLPLMALSSSSVTAPSPGVPAGDRLMSALGHRVRAARIEHARNGPMREDRAAEVTAPPAAKAVMGSRTDGAGVATTQPVMDSHARLAAAQQAAVERARLAAEQARAEAERVAAERARAERARAAAVEEPRAAEARNVAEATRRQRETTVLSPVPLRPPMHVEEPTILNDHPQASPAQPTHRLPARGSERSGLFGGGYRDVRQPAANPGRPGRPLAAVFSRIAELEEQPSERSEPLPMPPRPGGIFGRMR
jgi:hypothetical protein